MTPPGQGPRPPRLTLGLPLWEERATRCCPLSPPAWGLRVQGHLAGVWGREWLPLPPAAWPVVAPVLPLLADRTPGCCQGAGLGRSTQPPALARGGHPHIMVVTAASSGPSRDHGQLAVRPQQAAGPPGGLALSWTRRLGGVRAFPLPARVFSHGEAPGHLPWSHVTRRLEGRGSYKWGLLCCLHRGR